MLSITIVQELSNFLSDTNFHTTHEAFFTDEEQFFNSNINLKVKFYYKKYFLKFPKDYFSAKFCSYGIVEGCQHHLCDGRLKCIINI